MAIERGPANPPALRELSTTAIANTLGVSAVDIFVYDTRKDSDGGAWRKRTQNTSWYNETLNTATRGVRRDFPAVAVIVATTTAITLYDGDDPDLPMWMVFSQVGTNFWSSGSPFGVVCALNGIMYVSGGGGGARGAHFVRDAMSVAYTPASGAYTQLGGISNRNDVYTTWAATDKYYAQILSATVYDIAMTVLPNAPVDPATGLPVPTVAMATSGGISIIKDNFTVVNITPGTILHDTPRNVGFTSKNELWYTGGNNYDAADRYFHAGPIPSQSITQEYGNLTPTLTAGFRRYTNEGETIDGSVNGAQLYLPFDSMATVAVRTGSYLTSTQDSLVVGSKGLAPNGGVVLISENNSSPSNGMVAHMTTTSNSGWMHGNIKGAWLSDITAETATGAELTTNGDMSSSAGWSTNLNGSSGGSITFTGGNLVMTQGSNSVWLQASQAIQTVAGKTYTIQLVVSSATNDTYFKITVGTSVYSSNIGYFGYPTKLLTGTHIYSFTATSNVTYITIQQGSGATISGSIDSISVRLGDADRSYNNRGLQVIGSVTKSAVATGADLMAYSGFSANNYLQQPYNSSLDFGTGDFCVMAWIKTSNSANNEFFIWRGDTTNYFSIRKYDGSAYAVFDINGTTTNNGVSIADNSWHHIVGIRRGGISFLYVDSVLKNITNATGNVSLANATLSIGSRSGSTPAIGASIALVKISSSVPSDEQLTKIYNDEKQLFQAGAKATLYGSTDTISALAFDNTTQLLHVGTTSGRSVFEGLRRVENTTTPVNTWISASNGLVAEQ